MDDYSNILIDLFDLTLISARQKGEGIHHHPCMYNLSASCTKKETKWVPMC